MAFSRNKRPHAPKIDEFETGGNWKSIEEDWSAGKKFWILGKIEVSCFTSYSIIAFGINVIWSSCFSTNNKLLTDNQRYCHMCTMTDIVLFKMTMT